ncbi:MAG TPA: DUF1161 domain-containing protein [Solimonas sp.]|nr:DUF1161 domain-containing protein [Solimonas sp.]
MRRALLILLLSLPALPAQAAKPCEELKSEIAATLEANGVKAYTLDVVPAAKARGRASVGSCDGGARRIVYRRGNSV